MCLKPGVYYLQNVMSGTVLDLRSDKKGVDGFAHYGGVDQQWEIGRLGNRGWFIRSCYSDSDHYLNVEASPEIAVNPYPAAWVFEHEPKEGENVYKIHWPNSALSFDLDCGNRNDGVRVFLFNKYDARQQLWKLLRLPESDKKSQNDQSSTTVMEDKAGTTTTTTVTTVTTTTRTIVTKKNDPPAEENPVAEDEDAEGEKNAAEEKNAENEKNAPGGQNVPEESTVVEEPHE